MNASADHRLAATLSRLSQVAPAASAAAGAALSLALAPLHRSAWPDVVWQASRLTDDGFPVEFSWSSREAAVRWTAEVAGPEVSDQGRLDLALALVSKLRGTAVVCPDDIRASFTAVKPPYRFGCWLGARHDALETRTKIYVELPTNHAPEPITTLVKSAIGKSISWRMLGWDPQTGRRELYGRLPLTDLHEPAVLAKKLGLVGSSRLTEALGLLLASRRSGQRPLGSESGLSIALSPTGKTEALCWFGPARLIHPAPSQIYARICAVAQNLDTSILTALAANDVLGRIGLVGAGLTADGETWYHAGWRP
jgi:hypothetical protein